MALQPLVRARLGTAVSRGSRSWTGRCCTKNQGRPASGFPPKARDRPRGAASTTDRTTPDSVNAASPSRPPQDDVRADASTAIHRPGRFTSTTSAAPAGTLRGVLAATELGYISLVVTYHSTEEGPRSALADPPSATQRRMTLTKASDKRRRWLSTTPSHRCSMGAAIALWLAVRPRHQGLIAALVPDAPILNRDRSHQDELHPQQPVTSQTRGSPSDRWPPRRHTGAHPTPILRLDRPRSRTHKIHLILHDRQDDDSMPSHSQVLRDARPELVDLESFDAGYTLSWNSDPDRWQNARS